MWRRREVMGGVAALAFAMDGAVACGARSELFDGNPSPESATVDAAAGVEEAGAAAAPGTPSSPLGDARADAPPSNHDAETGDTDGSPGVPCQAGGDIFYLEGQGGYPGISGQEIIRGTGGLWSSVVDGESFLQLNVSPTNDAGPWTLSIESNVSAGAPLAVGTYASTGAPAAYVQVVADGVGCPTVPTGAFTIAEISYPDIDQSSVTSLFVWFELTCPDAGVLSGCVSYGR